MPTGDSSGLKDLQSTGVGSNLLHHGKQIPPSLLLIYELFSKNLEIIPSLHQNYRCTARGSQQHFCAVELFLATQPSLFLFFFSSFAYDHLICMRMTFVAPVISSDNGQLAKRI